MEDLRQRSVFAAKQRYSVVEMNRAPVGKQGSDERIMMLISEVLGRTNVMLIGQGWL